MALLKTDLDDKLADDEKKDFEELIFDLEELWKEMMVPAGRSPVSMTVTSMASGFETEATSQP